MANSLVKFINCTNTQYTNLANKDADTLYWVTDKGVVYKGTDLFAQGLASASSAVSVKNVSGRNVSVTTFTFTDKLGNTTTIDTASPEGLAAAMAALDTHAAVVGSSSTSGHVKLSDSTSSTSSTSSGVAATPKAVNDALNAAKSYADGILAAGDAMVFKGTIDNSTSGSATVHALPTYKYSAGWTYKVVTAGTYAGVACEVGDMIIAIKDGPQTGTAVVNADWTVVQTNIDGAVTASGTLTANAVMLGNGTKTAKVIANGTAGQVLTINSSGVPSWANNAASDEKVKTTAAATSTDYYVIGVGSAAGTQEGKTNTGIKFNGTKLTAGSFAGDGASITNLKSANISDKTSTIASGSNNVATSGGVYTAIEAAKLKWQTIS